MDVKKNFAQTILLVFFTYLGHPLIGVAVHHRHRRHRAAHPTLPEESGSALQSMRPGRLVGSDPNRTADRDYFPTPFLCDKLGI
jgi:hypothetical protein